MFPTASGSRATGQRKIVLWVPNWSVAALASAVPAGAPAATVVGGRVHECTRAASRLGICPGMRQLTAQNICSELLLIPHDPVRDAAEFEGLLQVFDQLVAGVCAIRPGLAWAPLPAEARWRKEEGELIQSLLEQCVSETGIEVYAGIGEGVAAAVGAARRGLILPAGQSSGFLRDLALIELVDYLPEEIQADYDEALNFLQLLGIRRVSQLLELGRTQLVSRLGPVGEKLWSLAEGGDLFVRAQATAAPQIKARYEFTPGVGAVDHALLGVRRVAQEFVDLMAGKGCVAHTLIVRLELSTGLESTRRWSLFDLTQSAQLSQRIIWQIRSWQDRMQQSGELGEEEVLLTAVSLEGTDVVTQALPQFLWGDKPQSDSVNRAVAQLQLLLGEESVRQPLLQGGMDPRERVELVPWGAQVEPVPREGEWAGSVQESPLLLFDQPPLAKVLGQQSDGTWGQLWINRRGILTGIPARIAVLEERPELPSGGYGVGRIEGMWAVRGKWWALRQEADAARCYLRLQVENSVDFLLIQRGQEWRVEGLYLQQAQPAPNFPLAER